MDPALDPAAAGRDAVTPALIVMAWVLGLYLVHKATQPKTGKQ